jgi:lipase
MPATHQLAVTEHLPEGRGPDGPLVVLVHGSLDRASSFARVVRRLDDLHTLAYDRRGYDRSRVLPVHDSIDGHIDDLLAVVDGRPAVVIGHSYGGVIALGAALSEAGKGSILSLGAYEPPLPWLGFRRNTPGAGAGSGSGTVRDADEDAAEAAERFFRRMVGDSAWERLPDEVKAERRADGPALVAELGAIRLEQPPFDPNELAVPAVFGRGGASLPHHRAAVAWLVENVRDSVLIEIPGAAHGAHLTHPDAFADLARTALVRAGRGRAPG